MKKFQFNLEPLLRVRKIEENRALQGLAKVLVNVNRMEEEKQTAHADINEEFSEFGRKNIRNLSFEDVQMHYRYMDRLDTEIQQVEEKLSDLKPDVEREQAKVVEARRRFRIVEMLKERKKEAYDYEVKKNEKKELQELKMMGGVPSWKQKMEKGAVRSGEKSGWEADDYEMDDELEEFAKSEKDNGLSDYFEQSGLDYPGKKK